MQITEPTTMLTDYALALIMLIFAVRLWQTGKARREMSVLLWSAAFVFTAIAAVLGGSAHGFMLYLSDFSQAAIWKATVYCMGFASLCMLAGTILASVSSSLRRWLMAAALLQFLLYGFWMISHDAFKYVIYDYVPALIAIVILQLYAHASRKAASAVWLIAGVLASFAAAGIQLSGFTIHEYFNHNDLYHVVQMGASYLLYRGASLL